MHSEKPSELVKAFKDSLGILDEDELPVGRAYAFGFLCHYTLDSTLHPLVFFHEYRLTDAGEPGPVSYTHLDVYKRQGVISCTTSSPAGTCPQPAKGSFLPAERADASARTSLAGKSTSCSTFRNSLPTAPVAPAMATTG